MPKLALRDLFAAVTIVALALGWAVDHWLNSDCAILEYRVRVLKAELERLGVKVTISENCISTVAPDGRSGVMIETKPAP